MLVLCAPALGSCLDPGVTTDVRPFDAARPDVWSPASPADAGAPWTGPTDDLACYPVVIFQTFGGYEITWTQGTFVACDEFFGFRIADADERAAAEAALGVPCDVRLAPDVCGVFGPHYGGPTREIYERICAIDAALGPREWICQQGE